MRSQLKTVRVVIEGENCLPQLQRKDILKQVRHVLAWAQLPPSWLFVTFVSEDRMRQLNKRWRNIDRSTDVLSLSAETQIDASRPYHVLGDILICPDIAARQAKQLGHALWEEIAVLTAHAAAHLLGLDHERGSESASQQLKHEQSVLRAAGLDDSLALTGRNRKKNLPSYLKTQSAKLQRKPMDANTANPQDFMRRWQSFVQQEGLKFTKQRERIAHAFFQLTGHVTAEEMLQTVRKNDPNVSLATVYRTLKLLQQCRLARGHHFDNDQACFEPNTDLQDPHDHLICTSCNRIVEFCSKSMGTLQKNIASQHGFCITHRRIELYGMCHRCQKQVTKNNKRT
ncbi:MAG: rRNA maturation RNase YbeY [Myxococcota bacterium]